MTQLMPLNLHAWIEEHRHLLKPPVGNAAIWNSNFLVMVVGGPNRRDDYHVNPGEELFYQLEGDIVLKIMADGASREIPIRQGEIFLLPAGVPHSPQRPANTVGLVVEQPRASPEPQHLRWYCRRCNGLLFDAEFRVDDIGKQIQDITERFRFNKEARTCQACAEVFAV